MRIALVMTLMVCAGAGQDPSYKSAWSMIRGEHDKNGDGKVARSEYGRGDVRFDRLDRNGDGFITESDMQGAGARRGGGRPRGGGAGRGQAAPMSADKRVAVMLGRLLGADQEVDRAGFEKWFKSLDTNGDSKLLVGELTCVTSFWAKTAIKRLDGDGDEGLSKTELEKAYATADVDRSGTLSKSELANPSARGARGGGGRRNRGTPPAAGEVAPDFTLKTLDGKAKYTLSKFRGDRAVALIFGSYT